MVWLCLFLFFYPLIFFNREFIRLLLICFRPLVDPALGLAFLLTSVQLLFGFLPAFIVWLLLVSGQAIAPVNSMSERFRVAWYLFLYMLGRHGFAAAIRDGKIQSQQEPVTGSPGLLLIDFNSAVVVEENVPVRSLRGAWHGLLERLGLMDVRESPRVFGPGLAFLRPGAYIHSVVDLRRQFRRGEKASAYTRDGIEIQTNIWTLFQAGCDPTALPLSFTFVGRKPTENLKTVSHRRPENLRMVELKETPEGQIRVERIRTLEDLQDELSEADRRQIRDTLSGPAGSSPLMPYRLQVREARPPVFDPRYAFLAAFSDALDEEGRVIPWQGLPVKVAIDLYRQLLLECNYDDLYGSVEQRDDLNQDFPVRRIRSILSARLRNSGIRSFRLVEAQLGDLQEGATYSPGQLRTTRPIPLNAPQVLRNAGLSVIASGFGDLIPVSEAIYQQRLDNWRARWYQDLRLVEASRERDVMHSRARARMKTQQQLVEKLSQMVNSKSRTPNATAFQIYMELERLAGDPVTRQLLPKDTVALMSLLRNWARPEDRGLPDGRRIE